MDHSDAMTTPRPVVRTTLALLACVALGLGAIGLFAASRASASPPAISITSITPAGGPSAGGTTVLISGTGLATATAVTFGTTPASFSFIPSGPAQRPRSSVAPRVLAPGHLSATSPPGTPGTSVHITVTGPNNTSTTSAADLFSYAATAPAAPTITTATATATDGGIAVGWSDGASNGSSVISYTLRAYDGATLAATKSDCGASPCTINGLTNGTSYTVTASATNGVGEGSASNPSSAVTPFGVGWVEITGIWFAPGSDHHGTDFSGKDLSGGIFPASVDLSDSSFANADLTGADLSGTTLTGATGCGITGSPTLPTGWVIVGGCLATLPGAPATAAGAFGHSSVTVSWTPPTSDGGSPITSYTASVTGDPSLSCDYTVPTAPTPEVDQCQIGGLTDGTSYTFDVVAHTAAGDGPATTTGTVIPAILVDGYAVYPGANLAGAHLAGAMLSMVNLAGINFTGADLSGADLTLAILVTTNFTSANLSHANLAGQDLQNATLTDDNLGGVNLSGANLSSANLTSVDLTSVNFAGAHLDYARFGHIDDDESDDPSASHVNFSNATLNGATFGFDHVPADITGWTFAGADLTGVSLAGGDLSGTDMTGANLTDANLSGTVLVGTTLTGATVAGLNLSGSTLTNLISSGLTGTPTSLPDGWYLFSGGIHPASTPSGPASVDATPGYGSIDVSWTPPADDGGAAIASYDASVVGDPTLSCSYPVTVGRSEDRCTILGLADVTTYQVQVVATNLAGLSSDPVAASPVTTLSPAPTFTSPTTALFVRGQRGSFTVSADRATSYSMFGPLPLGLRFHDNGNGTATISGSAGRNQVSASIAITARGRGTTVQRLHVILAMRARILFQTGIWTGWATHRLRFHVASTVRIKVVIDAGGYVAPIVVTGLPSWATFTDNGNGTGFITGVPGARDVGTSTPTVSVTGLPGTASKQLIIVP